MNLSADGRTVSVVRSEEGSQGHVWTADVLRGIFSVLYRGDSFESSMVMTPDNRVIFSGTIAETVGDMYAMPVGGVGMPEALITKSQTVKHPNDVSADGRFLVFDDHTALRQDLWILPLQAAGGSSAQKPFPFLVTSADETFEQFSPDGRWITYSSDESDRREVYVQRFAPDRTPAAAVGKWQISTDGGDKPRWSADGRELFYLAPDRKLMAVPIKSGATLEPGVAAELFQTRASGFFPYDVAPDGRFLVNTLSDSGGAQLTSVTVVLNWRAPSPR